MRWPESIMWSLIVMSIAGCEAAAVTARINSDKPIVIVGCEEENK